MPTLQITEKEIFKLVDQLDDQKKIELFDYLACLVVPLLSVVQIIGYQN